MAIWAYAQPALSPLGDCLDGPYGDMCALLYDTVLPLLIPMIEDPPRFRDLWHDDDAQLTTSEKAIADGQVTIEEDPELDLAVVKIETDILSGGHRFASETFDLIHPLALHNATSCCRVLVIAGRHYMYTDRYETWVQYQTRSMPHRVDLQPLRDQLEALETGAVAWTASKPSALTPMLQSAGDSSLTPETVIRAVTGHLRSAPAAWNPFPG